MVEDKLITAEAMNVLIYEAIEKYHISLGLVTPNAPFGKINPALRAVFELQMHYIVENKGVKPAQLHDNFTVTGQKMIDQGGVEQDIVAKLKPYMIPFRELPVWKQTEYRLQLQLARTLLRHNRNVKRAAKRQR